MYICIYRFKKTYHASQFFYHIQKGQQLIQLNGKTRFNKFNTQPVFQLESYQSRMTKRLKSFDTKFIDNSANNKISQQWFKTSDLV